VKRLSVICVLLFLLLQGCDVDKSPLSDPADIYDQALAAVREQNYVYAKQLLEQVLPQLREQAVSVHLDDALFLLSRVEVKLGEFRASLNHLQEASVVARKEGNTDEEMQLSLFEADLYESLHEDHDAVAHYQSTLLLASAFDHASILIETKLRIASMLLKAGEDETALDEYKSLLDRQMIAAVWLKYCRASVVSTGGSRNMRKRSMHLLRRKVRWVRFRILFWLHLLNRT
jgi:tetratricopeptide (TPR) repeat protein